MAGIPLIIAFLVAIVAMILAISKFKLHPFLAILATAIVFGLIAGIPISRVPVLIGTSFSGIFMNVGLVLIFGALIGLTLDAAGGALKIADMLIKGVGKKSPTLSFLIMGWIVSVPIFCESAYPILNPIRKSTVKRIKASGVATAMGLSTGLYASHILIPLTPGPLIASYELGLSENLLLVIIVGTIISIPALIGAYFYSVNVGKRVKSEEDLEGAHNDTVKSYEDLVAEYGKLPNGLMALSPILAPILLMSLGTVANIAGWTGGVVGDIVAFMSTPVIALATGFVFAVVLLATSKRIKQFNSVVEKTLKMMGPILFITGAGGVLGHVIRESGVIDVITQDADALQNLGLFFPFLLGAVIKTAQGSSTVAMIITSGMVAPLMTDLGLDATDMARTLTVMAVGAGAMIVSHANDSWFWVVTRLSGISPQNGYKSQTTITLIEGLCCMAGVFIFSLVYFNFFHG
ncbi:MAG: GntP family permease [Treponema sp.]|nr:GntP family permease [Treponema sp.]